jgi:hypothetical protein
MKLKVIFALSLKLYFQKAELQKIHPKIECSWDAIEGCSRGKDYLQPAPGYFLRPLLSCCQALNK